MLGSNIPLQNVEKSKSVTGLHFALSCLQHWRGKQASPWQKTQFEKYWPSAGYHNTPHTPSIIEWFWPPGWEIAVVAGRVWVAELIYFRLQSCNRSNTTAEERRQLRGAIRHTHTHIHWSTPTQRHQTHIKISRHIHRRNITNPHPSTFRERQVQIHKVKTDTGTAECICCCCYRTFILDFQLKARSRFSD